MKKISIFLIFALLLSACSMTVNEFLGIPSTPTVVPTFFTNTPTDAPTFTPTAPTPTFTVTPTLIGQKTKTSTPAITSTQLIFTPLPVTLLPSTTPISLVAQVPMPGFVSISVSGDQFYKGNECSPVSVKFTTVVADASVAFVVLFVRFKSKQSGATSEWTSIPMQSQTLGKGIFTHDLIPLEMKALDSFENAWVQYQLVATDANSKKVGRSDVFGERLTLLECVATPTPTVSTASITPTAQVP